MRPLAMLVLALAVPARARAQWLDAGVPVCTALRSQSAIAIASDGAGGALLVWQDNRNSPTSSVDLYAGHLKADGTLDAAWPAQGAAVCTAVGNQLAPAIAADGEGGAYIVWADYRATSYPSGAPPLYATHLTSSGANATGWPADGMPISSRPAYDWAHFSVAADGSGGAFVSWQWRPPSGPLGIEALRLASAGVDPAWPADGTTIDQNPGADYTRVAADGQGGCWVAWTYGGMHLQRLGATGAPAAGWPSSGLLVQGPDANLGTTLGLIADGQGGAISISDGTEGEGARLVEQRVASDGTALWGSAGHELDAWTIDAEPQLVADGSGGLFTAWTRGIYMAVDSSTWDVEVFRQDATGAPAAGWTAPVSVNDAGSQSLPRMVGDGAGGVLVAWRNLAPGAAGFQALAQHFDGSGAIAPGWPAGGLPVCTSTAATSSPVMLADGAGGCIVAFTDGRNQATTGTDIYAQHLTGAGTVAAVPPVGSRTNAFLSVGPNPATRMLDVRFAVPRSGAAVLELLDASGRRVGSRTIDAAMGRAQTLRWEVGPALASGVYWVVLRHPAGVTSRRIAILR